LIARPLSVKGSFLLSAKYKKQKDEASKEFVHQ